MQKINYHYLIFISFTVLFTKQKLLAYNLKNAFKALFSSYNIQKEAIDTNFPKHLLNIQTLNKIADENLPKFEKFLKKNNVEDCTLEELLNFLKK